jgi:hypothetical protein
MKLENKTLCSIAIWWKLTNELKLKTKWVREGEIMFQEITRVDVFNEEKG